MRFCCPFCNSIVKAGEDMYGSRAKCPNCANSIIVPAGPFEEGCVIADYVVIGRIGSGSIGVVYKATQISLDRTVALKILNLEYVTKKGVADFLREARSAAMLTHVNLVQSYAVGKYEDCYYMAMTYLDGETLRSRLKREGRISEDESLHIIQQVAEALYYAWDECNLIHRDVKPDNIMLTEDGIAKLTDLGLAMNQSEWQGQSDVVSGSPSYMSPEQFRGEKLDTRTDIYSLGVTLFQMLSGRLPFLASTVTSIAREHFEQEVPDLTDLVIGISPEVVAIVNKMMAKDRNDRYSDMEELLKAIWSVRQHTAPNKDLVPDVHTISINRLDYGIQHNDGAQASSDAEVLKYALVKARKKVLLWKIASIVLFILSFAAGFFALRGVFPSDAAISSIVRESESFQNLSRDPYVPFDELKKSGEELIEKAEKVIPGGTLRDSVIYRVRSLLKERELQDLEQDYKTAQGTITTLREDNERLRLQSEKLENIINNWK